MSYNNKFVITRCFFQAENAPKPVFDLGLCPEPTGAANDAPSDSLVGWRKVWGEDTPSLFLPRRLRRLYINLFSFVFFAEIENPISFP